jgi:hypothetical protein
MTPLFSSQSMQSSMDWSLSEDDSTSTETSSGKEDGKASADSAFSGIRQTPHAFPQTQTGLTLGGGGRGAYGDTGAIFGTLTQYNVSNSVFIKAPAQTQGGEGGGGGGGFKVPSAADARSKAGAGGSRTQPLSQGGLDYYNVRIQKRFTKSPQKDLSGEFLGRQRALRDRKQRELVKKQQTLKRAHQVSRSLPPRSPSLSLLQLLPSPYPALIPLRLPLDPTSALQAPPIPSPSSPPVNSLGPTVQTIPSRRAP